MLLRAIRASVQKRFVPCCFMHGLQFGKQAGPDSYSLRSRNQVGGMQVDGMQNDGSESKVTLLLTQMMEMLVEDRKERRETTKQQQEFMGKFPTASSQS